MRTFIAMVLCGITSPTDWVNDYLSDDSGFYAIISGFLPENIPSVGCLYEFMRRILSIPKYCREKHIRKKRKRLTKDQKKQLKQDKEKVSKRHVKIVSKLAKRFSRITTNKEEIYVPEYEKMVNSILELCVVYTHPDDNPRLFPTVPRSSQKWQNTYDKRTSAERVFKLFSF